MLLQSVLHCSCQGVVFLPKVLCDVTKAEIAAGVRLTRDSVEGFTVQVPRTRLNYFQDDIYPDTLCVEEASLTVERWLQGENALQKLCSLKPPNMKSCMCCVVYNIVLELILHALLFISE